VRATEQTTARGGGGILRVNCHWHFTVAGPSKEAHDQAQEGQARPARQGKLGASSGGPGPAGRPASAAAVGELAHWHPGPARESRVAHISAGATAKWPAARGPRCAPARPRCAPPAARPARGLISCQWPEEASMALRVQTSRGRTLGLWQQRAGQGRRSG
jgi:hypothetical protein